MAEVQWFYSREGQQLGPVPEAELMRMAQSGDVQPATLVWRAGMAQWQPAQQATNFFAAGAAAPAPPPPIPPPGAMPPPGQYPPYPGHPGYAPPADLGQNAGMRMLLPVGRSGWAIAAGYLGLFSVLLLPAPLAVIISLVAISDIRKDSKKHGMGRAIFGLIMGILGTIVLGLALITAATSR